MNAAEILVVEDNLADAELLMHHMKERGYSGRVSVVSDGVSAIDFLHHRGRYRGSAAPRCIVLDLNLPRKSGWEVLSEIKQSPKLAAIPVVVLTTSNRREDAVACMANGASCFLTKPCDFEQYGQVAERILAT